MDRQELTKGSVLAPMQALMILSHLFRPMNQNTLLLFFHSTFFLKRRNVLVIHRCKHSDTRMSLPLFSMLLRYNAFTSYDTQLQNRLSILGRTQRQFSENICSEDDLRSRIFRNICCKMPCLPASPRIFEHLKKW